MSENQTPELASEVAITSGEHVMPVKKASWLGTICIVLFIVCCLLGVAFWFAQSRFEASGRAVASQLQGLSEQVANAQREAKQASALVDSHASRIAQLELSLRESQEQFESLEEAWQTFNNGMDNAMLVNDIERLLTLASQQLRLAGNVNNAIMALETALSELVRANRTDFTSLQRAISLDLERLRTAPSVDLSALSVRLESLITLTSRAPLLVPDGAANLIKPQLSTQQRSAAQGGQVTSGATSAVRQDVQETMSSTQDGAASDANWWDHYSDKFKAWGRRLIDVVVKDLSGVVSIQRVNDPNALLLSPEQGAQLRENLRARLLTAQLSLLMRQPNVWRDELAMVESILQSRFDVQSFDTLAAINLVHELQAIPVSAPLPDITGSFSALEAVRSTVANAAKGAE